MRVGLRPVESGQTWEMGPYRVTALPAYHALNQQMLTYVIEREGASVLYASAERIQTSRTAHHHTRRRWRCWECMAWHRRSMGRSCGWEHAELL
jgi:hypothetical protein